MKPNKWLLIHQNESGMAINPQHIVYMYEHEADDDMLILLSNGDKIKANDMCLVEADQQLGVVGLHGFSC